MSLEDGIKALEDKQYQEAIKILEAYCQQPAHRYSPSYVRAQITLARAYRGNNQRDKALALGRSLQNHLDTEVSDWAKGFISIIDAEEKASGLMSSGGSPSVHEKAARATQTGIALAMKGVDGNLNLAASLTVCALFGIIFSLFMVLFWLLHIPNGLIIAFGITIVFNAVAFFASPLVMDFTQKWLYKVRWVSLAEIKRSSPESATVIQRVCREKRLKPPRLGIIDDQNPTAFTYGSLPGTARLIISQGLFTYLDDDEVAAVYAHELGHIVHWDFAIITLGATFVQLTYLLYLFCGNISQGNRGNNQLQVLAGFGAIAAFIFYLIGNYVILYLSRTREYFADHFAAETTGNPNGLSRALVKIAYGIVEESRRAKEPNRLMESTRALSIYDTKTALATGTAYRLVRDLRKIGQIFLWDLFNPWSAWIELNSTHPLTGKRIRVLTNYAEQLGLKTEFDMVSVVKEGNKLDKGKLSRHFVLDMLWFNAQWIGILLAVLLGLCLKFNSHIGLLSLAVLGFGMGLILRTFWIYPNFQKAASVDVYGLMCDPYSSPFRGRPIQLQGQLIGRSEAGYAFGSDIMLEEQTGLIYARYSSRLGALGNFFFGWTQVKDLIDSDVNLVGWFRRGISPWIDWSQLVKSNITVRSYPRFCALMFGSGAIMVGIVLLIFVIGNHVSGTV